MPANASLTISPTRTANGCALVLMVLGVLVMAEWLLAFEPLSRLLPGAVSMKFNAALCTFMAGAGLWWRARRGARTVLGLLIASLGFLTLVEYGASVDLGIDPLFAADRGTPPDAFPGRLAPLVALSFVLTGLGLTLLRARSQKARLGAEVIVLCVAAVQFIALLGHATGVRFLYAIDGFGSLALLSAVALFVLSIGLLAALKETPGSVFASGKSPTRLRLLLGFGFITALLLALGVFSAARLNSIETSVTTQAVEAQARLTETYELEINVLDYGLDVRVFIAGDAASFERAAQAASGTVTHLDAYAGLAKTPKQQDFAKQLSAQWQSIYETGQSLLAAGQATPEQLSSLAIKRMTMDSFLDDEVQPDAMRTLSRTEADIASALQHTKSLTLALLVAAISAALITSSVVRHAVLGGERALQEREERLRLATVAAELGIWTWHPDVDQVTWENSLPDIDFTPEPGVPPLSATHIEAAWVHPDDRPAFSQAIEDALGTNERVTWQGRMQGPNGQLRWIELTGQAAAPFSDSPRRVIGTLRDITARQQAAEALHQSEQRFRALFNLGPIAIYSCDLAGKIVEFNHAAATLWQRTPKPGDTCETFAAEFKFFSVDGTPSPFLPANLKHLPNNDVVDLQDAEFMVERPDGSRITVVASVVALTNEHGEQTGSISCCYETTERSRLELQTQAQARTLADLHRRKDEFLAMLGHELRNPLAAMANAVQLLRLNQHADTSLKQGRSIIERQVRQLKHLVDDLLEVSRITTGSVRLRQQQVNLRSVVERALETAQPIIAAQRHELSVTFPQHSIYLHADGARLEQVLVNLLSNAAKYTQKGGRIALSLEEEADGMTVAIRVRDNGIGIAPDLLPHIFELFTQAERSLDRSQGGLGIGLSLVQRLVELHGGSVVAHSELGRGSEFVVRLPLMQAAVPTAPAPLTEVTASQTGGLQVMVVDDNVDAAESLAVLLEMTGHAVRLAYDGPSALQAVITHRPQVVLLDIGLPGLDGFEVAQRIRKQSALDGVTLVALTGYGQDSDRQRALDAGFDYHLVKPADFGEIEKILVAVQETVLAGALHA